MKISITVEEDGSAATPQSEDGSAVVATTASPPEDVLARARAVGAISAGAAPQAPSAEAPPAFVPGAAASALAGGELGAAGDRSGGGAPAFLAARGDYDADIDAAQVDAGSVHEPDIDEETDA